MDYRYIEQLIERYFAAETSQAEEHILREFFAQEEVPEHLQAYQPLFRAEAQLSEAHLDERFDERLLQMADEVHVRARRISLSERLRPLLKAAAFVALAVVMGTVLERATFGITPKEEPAPQTADVIQDELDATETTTLDVQSAELRELPDTIVPTR